MKTTLINSLVGSAIAITIAAALALSAQAGGQTKGSQQLLQPSQTTTAADTAPANGAKMNCPMCQDVPVENVKIEKGHIRTVTYSQKHLCPMCDTTIGVTGAGKAKKDLVTHTCSMASGCAMTTGT